MYYNISSRLSCNSEADASELQDNLQEMLRLIMLVVCESGTDDFIKAVTITPRCCGNSI